MSSVVVLLICLLVLVNARAYEERVEIKDREREDWRPLYGPYDDRIKQIKHKDKVDDKMLIESTRPYYPGFYTVPIYIFEGVYHRPAYLYPDVNYYIRKELKDKPLLKTE